MIIFVNHLALSQSDSTRTVDDEKKPLKRTNSFVGTAQFVAPEILKRGAIHVGFVKNSFSHRNIISSVLIVLDLICGH
jgi:hypothetical protein